MKAACAFCDRRAFEDRLVLESANFHVFPTKGQIVEGYVLLAPKRHMICLGELTDMEMAEFIEVKERVSRAMVRAYEQRPIFFEHGIVGQSVKHAHVHAVPTEANLFPRIHSDFPDYQKTTSLASLQETFQREGPYLYYENQDGEMFVFHIFKWPQYLRIVLAEVVGLPERGDWRKMDKLLDDTMMLETQKKLKPII